MEGDAPTGTLVLSEFVELKAQLTEKLASSREGDGIHVMLTAMLKKTLTYLSNALKCETLVMAALLNPMLGLEFFQTQFDDALVAIDAEVTLSHLYNEQKDLVKEISTVTPTATSQATSTHTHNRARVYRTSKKDPNTKVNEIEAYFKDEDYIPEDQAHDPHSILTWWKVSISLNT